MENVRILKNVINNFLCLKEESAVKKNRTFLFFLAGHCQQTKM